MRELMEAGEVSRVGVSVYDVAEMELALSIPELNVLQIPFNVLDRRLLPLALKALQGGREVFVRSVYLQGLLLMSALDAEARLPGSSVALAEWRNMCAGTGLPPAVLALGYVRRALPGARILAGCETAEQVMDNTEMWELSKISDAVFAQLSELAEAPVEVRDPRLWKVAK